MQERKPLVEGIWSLFQRKDSRGLERWTLIRSNMSFEEAMEALGEYGYRFPKECFKIALKSA